MDRKQKLIELRNKGYSYTQIGRLFDISSQRVHQILSGYKNNQELSLVRQGIFERDKFQCQKCEATNDLLLHHLDKNNKNNNPRNLITLCGKCHLNLHRPTNTNFKVFRNGLWQWYYPLNGG